MWTMIESLSAIVAVLAPTFTQPSFAVNCELLLCWVMCLGKHRLQRVAENANPAIVPDHSQAHGLDKYYNFFERSAWTRLGLAYRVAVLIVAHMPLGMRITLLVDDTLAHKRGKSVWGLGWWRDAVASTRKRVATASGHNWVVLAVADCVPFTNAPIFSPRSTSSRCPPGPTPSGSFSWRLGPTVFLWSRPLQVACLMSSPMERRGSSFRLAIRINWRVLSRRFSLTARGLG